MDEDNDDDFEEEGIEGNSSIADRNGGSRSDSDSEESDEDSSNESDSEGSDEDSGWTPTKLIDLKLMYADGINGIALRVKVVERDRTEVKSGQEQFLAVVADATSAVDVCVRNNEDLFRQFVVGCSLILLNVDWNGNVIFANEKCKATSVSPMIIKQHIINEAFGQGKAVPISKARTLPVKSWVALRGKVVKQSVVTKVYCFKKLLAHRQIKLKDRSGSVYVDVWGDVAVNRKVGDAIKLTGCKIQKPETVGDPEMTSTRKTCIKKLDKSEFKDLHMERRYERGTLEGINVEIYTSCSKPLCYNFKLGNDCSCKSCQCTIMDPVMYATAEMFVTAPKQNTRQLTVLWPQLRQLFRLFGKRISLKGGMPTLEDQFQHLQGKTVRFKTCGIVRKFKLE